MKCTPEGGGWGNGEGEANYMVYFCAEFSHPLKLTVSGQPIFLTDRNVNVRI